jgi:transposase-like protein
MIYTTNAIESLHMQVRKVIKNRGHFPSDEPATKLIAFDVYIMKRRHASRSDPDFNRNLGPLSPVGRPQSLR